MKRYAFRTNKHGQLDMYISRHDGDWLHRSELLDILSAFSDRVTELEGFVGDDPKREQRHLEVGATERVYWHYGYMMALKDVLKRLDGDVESKR